MNDIPKISILVICYKQEDLIKRAIGSLLQQKEYLYEICVSDDCSPDNTWQVLQEYSKQYPGLFKLHQNNPNLGIFQNIEQSWTMPSGDLVYMLSGDDECPDGWFKAVSDFVVENHIDYKNRAVCIYGDYKCLYPNGDCFIGRNNFVLKKFDPVSMSIRGLISNRSSCASMPLIKKLMKVSQGRSYVVEWAQDKQFQLLSEHNYYIPQVGNIYYTRIGINMHMSEKIRKERENTMPYLKECFEKTGYVFNKKDTYYILYQKERWCRYRDKSLGRRWRQFKYRLLSTDYRFGFFDMKIRKYKRYAFALLRRLPHNKPLKMKI